MLKDKGLFLKAETQTALWVPWDTVGPLIGDKLEKLLQMTFHVRAEYRDADYWCCEFGMNYIDVFMQERPFMAIDAIEDERQEMMGCGGARLAGEKGCHFVDFHVSCSPSDRKYPSLTLY